MSNLKNWLNTFEKLKEQRKPLFKEHQLAKILNAHEQNSYAVLHAAFILFNGSITKNQERLYSFWLPSISTQLKLSEIINQAQEFDGEKLKEAITLIESKELFELLLLDVLVFTRLEGGLSNELKQILNEWCQLLRIEQKVIENVVAVSDHILGTSNPKQPKLNSTVAKLLSNPVWSEFYIKELNRNNINNANGGIWRIDKDILDLTDESVIKNALIVFNNKAKITWNCGQLELQNVGLIQPRFVFNDVPLVFDNVTVQGDYKDEDQFTVFEAPNTNEANVTNSYFATKGARTFLFDTNSTTGLFDKVIFSGCGNNKLLGGALKYQQGLKFTDCRFENCTAKVAGAAFLKYLTEKSFENCKFISCTSEHKWQEGVDAGSLYFGEEAATNNIIDCFIDNNISVYQTFSYGSNHMLCNSIIKGSINYCAIRYSDYSYSNCLDVNSVIKNGVTDTRSKNRYIAVTKWDVLVNEEAA